MTALITTGFHHISLITADARRAQAFYGDALGLRLVAGKVDMEGPGSTPLWFSSRGGEPGTLLNVIEMAEAPRGRYGVGGTHHVALGTATYETLLMWKRRLVDLGIPVSGPMPRGYFTSLYFRDPDGQVVEIATSGPGYAIDEPMDALGRGVMSPGADQLPGGRDDARIAATTHPEPVPEISPAMAIDAIHHITAMTDDIGRAHEFYEEALGLRLIKKTVNQDDPETPHWLWANYDGTRVLPSSGWTLFGWTPRHPKARAGIGQAAHVAFRAKDAEEQLAWREHLLAMGLDVSAVQEQARHRSIAFRAPDGQPLLIATDAPG
jgi:glyoxalase family protein